MVNRKSSMHAMCVCVCARVFWKGNGFTIQNACLCFTSFHVIYCILYICYIISELVLRACIHHPFILLKNIQHNSISLSHTYIHTLTHINNGIVNISITNHINLYPTILSMFFLFLPSPSPYIILFKPFSQRIVLRFKSLHSRNNQRKNSHQHVLTWFFRFA